MNCENYFCVYWAYDACTLDEISLDIRGSCQDCINVTIAENVLQKERKAALQRYEERCEWRE